MWNLAGKNLKLQKSSTEEKENCSVRTHNDLLETTSQKRLRDKQSLRERVEELAVECESLREEVDGFRNAQTAGEEAAEKIALMPTWRHVRPRGKCRSGMQLEYQHRVAILEQHANGTPPSAIGRNIVSVVKAVAPDGCSRLSQP